MDDIVNIVLLVIGATLSLQFSGYIAATLAADHLRQVSTKNGTSLRVTPAMEAGVSNHVWSIEELAGLLD